MTETPIPDRSTSDQVLIALRKIIQAIDLNSKQLIRRVGLTGPQLVLLQAIHVSETGGQPELTVGQIAKTVSLSQGTVTGILERMEKRNLVVRHRNETDRRRVMVRVTEAGKALLRDAPPVMHEDFLQKFSDLEDWEKAMIQAALQRLVSLLGAGDFSEEPFLSAAPVDAGGMETAEPVADPNPQEGKA